MLLNFLENLLFIFDRKLNVQGISVSVIFIILTALMLIRKIGFIGITRFKDAIDTIMVKHENRLQSKQDSSQQISPFKAFCIQASSALGVANIVGASFALCYGGIGSVFWIIVFGLTLSTVKFAEITLGVKYRTKLKNGSIIGGFSQIIRNGIIPKTKNKHKKQAYKALAVVSSLVLIFFPVLWSGFQLNQSVESLIEGFHVSPDSVMFYVILISTTLALLTFMVIKGNVSRLGFIAEVIVPAIAASYIILCITLIGFNFSIFPKVLSQIMKSAFDIKSVTGGMISGVSTAIIRVALAGEFGLGTSSISHATANVDKPARQGLLAVLDGILVSTILSLGIIAIYMSGVRCDADCVGASVIIDAVKMIHPICGIILSVIIALFGSTSLIGNGYYLKQASEALMLEFGKEKWKSKVDLIATSSYCVCLLLFSFYPVCSILKLADAVMLWIFIPNCFIVIKFREVIFAEIKKLKKS